MFDMGMETLDLPDEEKAKFEQGDSGASFGYGYILIFTLKIPT